MQGTAGSIRSGMARCAFAPGHPVLNFSQATSITRRRSLRRHGFQSFQVLVAEHLKGRAMFEFILAATARSYFFLRRFMPTAIVIDAINTRRGLKWGVPAMLLAVPYAVAAEYCRAQIEAGGPGWLNLLVLVSLWNTIKFVVIGPVSMLKLIAVRVRETVARPRMARALPADNLSRERLLKPVLTSKSS